MTHRDAGPPAGFVVRWTAATLAGWVLGIALVVALAQACDAAGFEDVQCVTGLGVGAGVGLAQGRMLAARLGGAWPWARATLVGMGAPFVAADAATLVLGAPSALPLSTAAGALFAGWLQSQVLRRESPRAGWWIAASAAGWLAALAFVLGSAILWKLLPKGWPGLALLLLVWTLGGALFGVVTGFALRRILRRG